jgi:hypothetical protein
MVWSIKPNIYQEERPDSIMRFLNLSRFASSRHVGTLPQYQSLARNGTHLSLKLSSGYRPLRSILHIRELMQQRASVLIKALLTAYLEVHEHKLTLRNLSPTTVMLDQTLSNVIFSDISEFCSWGESVQVS